MSRYFPGPDECGRHVIFGCVSLRTYAGDQLQLSLVDIPAEGVVDWHSHPNEQMGMMITGRALFHIGDEVRELGPGDFYLIPGNIPHKVVPVGGAGQALDIFYPIREEYK